MDGAYKYFEKYVKNREAAASLLIGAESQLSLERAKKEIKKIARAKIAREDRAARRAAAEKGWAARTARQEARAYASAYAAPENFGDRLIVYGELSCRGYATWDKVPGGVPGLEKVAGVIGDHIEKGGKVQEVRKAVKCCLRREAATFGGSSTAFYSFKIQPFSAEEARLIIEACPRRLVGSGEAAPRLVSSVRVDTRKDGSRIVRGKKHFAKILGVLLVHMVLSQPPIKS